MKVKQVPVRYEKIFIAEDGTEWQSRIPCQEYEELSKDCSPLKEYQFFDNNGNPLDIFTLGKIPEFCYLIITEEMAHTYQASVVQKIIGDKEVEKENSYYLPHEKGLYYNDWTNAHSGNKRGYNGWYEVKHMKSSLEATIESWQKEIELLKKIKQHLEK